MPLFSGFRKWLRSVWLRDLRGQRRRQPIRKTTYSRPLVEELEDRTLLSVSVTTSGGADVKFFSGLVSDNVYLKTVGTQVQWSPDGSSWSNVGISLASAGGGNTFTFQMSGGVYLQGLTGLGGSMTFTGVGQSAGGFIGPKDVSIQGNLFTKGGNLTFNDVQGVDVSNSVVVSTRQISAADQLAGNYATGLSTGNSGTVSMAVNNTDPLNPVLYIDFTDPHITLGSNVKVLAGATTGFSAGDVSLDVTNINYSLLTQLFTLFSLMQRNASISVGTGSSITGNNVSMVSHAGDLNPLDLLAAATGKPLSPGASDSLATGSDRILGLLNPFVLPFSVFYRNSSATVSIGQSANINAKGAVNLESNANANAGATSMYIYGTRVQLSLALSWAQSDAETTIAPSATITGGGDVNIHALANSVSVTSSQAAYIGANTPPPANAVQIAGGVGIDKVTSHAIVSQGATVTSGGNVNVRAEGVNSADTKVAAKSNSNGTAGLTFGASDSTVDVLAQVDGTINAVGAPVGTVSTINPFTQIDWGATNSIITFNSAPQYSTGEEISYSSANDGVIPGLVNGSNYYVIAVSGHSNQIQLARSYSDAINGIPIIFGTFPYLTATINGDLVNVPITQIDTANSALKFSYNPGFTAGQTVTYHVAPNQAVGSLTDGQSYTIQFVAGQANEYKLLDSGSNVVPVSLSSTFGAIPYITTTIAGVTVNLPIPSVSDVDNALVFPAAIPGLANLTVTYHAADGQAIWNLVNGQSYTIKQLGSSGGEYQLFDASSNLIPIFTDPGFTGLAQNVDVGLSNNTLTLGFNAGFSDLSRVIYQGAADGSNNAVNISGLTVGQAYWMLPVAGDTTGTQYQLATSMDGTALAISGSVAKFKFTPFVGIDASTNTINVGFNIGNVPGFPTSGKALTYQGALGLSFSGLHQGQTYYAIVDPDPYNGNTLYLANTPADAALAYTAGQTSYQNQLDATKNTYISQGMSAADAQTAANNTAVTAGYLWSALGIMSATDATPPPAGPYTVTTVNNELQFSFAPGIPIGTPISYLGATSGGITGLTTYTTYYAIPDPNNANAFGLAATPQDAYLRNALTISGSGTINLGPAMPNPTSATLGADALTFEAGSDQGWRTGDQIVFGGAFDSSGNSVAISNLTVGQTYYAIVDTNTPNVVQLADSLANANANVPLTLTATTTSLQVNLMAPLPTGVSPFPTVLPPVMVDFGDVNDETMSGGAHTFTPIQVSGVSITASLLAKEKIVSQAQPGRSFSTSGVSLLAPYVYSKSTLGTSAVGNNSPNSQASANPAGNQSPASAVQGAPGASGTGPKWSSAGSFVVLVSNNTVNAIVGSSAIINSSQDVNVIATMTDTVQESSAATLLVNPLSATKVASALAVTIGVVNSTVKATVNDGAHINASGAFNVHANITYPFTFPTSAPASLADILGFSLGAVLGVFLDNTLGLQTVLFNGWTQASSTTGPPDPSAAGGGTPGGAQYGIAGVIDVHYWNNDVEATIGNAFINQDSSFDRPGQSVDVEADTTWDNIDMAGVFDLNASAATMISNLKEGKPWSKGASASGIGSQSQKSGLGATININIMSNTTLALIKTGARLRIGPSGTLGVKANHDILSISLNQSGASAGDIGFAGTIVWNNLVTSTIAQVQDGVLVNQGTGDGRGGAMTVKATDDIVMASLAGGVAKANHIGFGFTLAVDNFDRTTLALVGSNPLTNGGATPAAGGYNIASLDVEALTTGVIVAASYAAGISTPAPPPGANPLGGAGMPSPPPGTTGVGAAADVGIVVMKSTTEAAIIDSGIFSISGNVTVNAQNQSTVVSIAGALGQSEQLTGGNVGLAGSFGVNVLTSITDAFIYGAQITANALSVAATHMDNIGALSAGAGGASPISGMGSTGIAGSVSVNLILPSVQAYISGANVSLVGDSSVTADEKSAIWSIAGALAYGGTGGYGVSVGLNIIGSPTIGGVQTNPVLVPNQPNNLPVINGLTAAFISASTITMVGGTLTVTAHNENPATDPRIIAICGAIGAGTGAGGTGDAGMLSVNIIQYDTKAYITGNSSVTEVAAPNGVTDPGAASIAMNANDISGIVSIGGGIAVGSGEGVGAAFSWNEINNNITADIESTTVDINGSVGLNAHSQEKILAVDVGVGVGKGTGIAGAGSLAVNVISDATDAHIKGSSITADTGITLSSSDTAEIDAGAGQVAFATSGPSVGASVVSDTISNIVRAYIDSTTVTASSGAVSLTSTSDLSITSIAAGGSFATTFTLGASLVTNKITDTTTAQLTGGSNIVSSTGLAISATDSSHIGTGAGDVSIAAAGSAVGAAIALNKISNTVKAYVDHSTVNASGNVSLSATSSESILAIAIGVGGSASNGAFSASLVGSGAGNTVTNSTEAYISASSVTTTSSGNVILRAIDSITLTAGAGVFSLALATKGGVGIAVGVSAATNAVGSSGTPDDVKASIEGSTVNADGKVSLTATDSASILAVTVAGSGSIASGGGGGVGINGAGAGSGNTVYVSTSALINGNSTVSTHNAQDVSLTASNTSTIEADGGGLSIAGSFSPSAGGAISVGAAVAINTISDSTLAIIAGSTVIAAGAVVIAATSNQTIKAITIGIAGSLAGGSGGGIAFGGAGSGSGNTITDDTEALIVDGLDSNNVSHHSYVTSGQPVTGTTLANKDVTLTATESAFILAGAGALGVGIGTGATGVGLAIGVSAASNSITDTVTANINSSMVNAGGNVTLNASTQPAAGQSHSIYAVTIAGGVAAGVSEDAGIAFAGAGAGSGNTISNTITASITNSSGPGASSTQLGVTTSNGGNVSLSATDNSDILADGGGISLALGIGTDPLSLGAGIAIGMAIARNSITNATKAYVDSSSVSANGKVSITARSTATINSTAYGVAIGGSAGLVAASAAGSGAESTNTIHDTVYAYIQKSSTVSASSTASDTVKVSATDTSSTTSKAGAGSLSGSLGAGGAGLALGASLANNTVGNDIEAFIGTASGASDTTSVTSSGGVQVLATSTTSVNAVAVAVAATIVVAPDGGAFSGSGASSDNTITNTITAAIRNGSTVHANGTNAAGKVQVSATDTGSSIIANVGAGALAIGVVAASMGVSLVDNEVTNTISAYIDHATVTTKGQELDVTATSTVTIAGLSVATSAAIGFGVSGAGGHATSVDNTTTDAYIGTGASIDTHGYTGNFASGYGALVVSATSTGGSISAECDGGSGGLGAIGVFLATASLGGSTIAHVGENSTINVGAMTVSATSGQTVTTRTIAVVIGAIAGSGTQSLTTIGNDVEAYVGAVGNTTASIITATGAVSVTASNTSTGSAEADGGLAGAFAIAGNVAHTTINPTVKAFVSNSFTVNAGAGMTVSATATNSATSNTMGVSVTIYGIGVSDSQATVDAHVAAYVGNVTLNVTGSLTISALSTDTATSSANASGGAYLVGANGATATATIHPDVQAYTGTATITASGNVSILAKEVSHASATGNSVTVTLGLAVGVVLSDAEVTNDSGKNVAAYLGAGSTLTANTLAINASQLQDSAGDPTAKASSTAAAGSLVGIIATSSTANTSTAVDAHIGDGSTLTINGADPVSNGQATAALVVQATNTTNQNAYVSGKQGALFLAVGVNSDTASSNNTTTGYVGNNVKITAASATLHIGATGSDTNRADAVSGAGAIISGASTKANTSTTSTTSAYIGTGISTKLINTHALQIAAEHDANFNSTVDAINASLVGGSAADANNSVTSTVNANIGAGANIVTYGLDVTAVNNEIKRLFGAGQTLTSDPTGQYDGNNVSSASGAAIGDFPGAHSASTIANTTAVNVGDGATLNVIGDYFNPGDFILRATNNIQAVDKVSINNGAFIAASTAGSSITADTDSATVNIGTGASGAATVTLNSIGDINAEAVSVANIRTNADAKTYGFAGGAAGTSTSEVKNNDTIHLYANAYLHALNNINLLAGRQHDATQNYLVAQANTDLFIGVGFGGTTPNANANIYQTNYVLVDSGAQVLSVGDANLYAVQGYHRADGEGHGEVRVAGVPLELDGGESTDNPVDGVIVNGTVKVGIQHIQNLTINEKVGGTATSTGVNPDGTTFSPQVGGATVTAYGSLTGIINFSVASINATNKQLTINVPSGYSFVEGQTLVFFTTSPGVAGTLQNGQSYTVHVISNGASQSVIQLKDGSNTVIGADPATASSDSLQAFGGSFPISAFDSTTNNLTVQAAAAFPLVEGRLVTYTSPAGTDTNYTAHIVSGPDSSGNMVVQLKDSNDNVVAISSTTYTLPSINIDEQSRGVNSPTVTAENLGLDLFNQVTNLLNLIAAHSGDANAVAGYKSQVAAINLELISLGLISPNDPAYSNPSSYAPAIPDSYTVFYINIPDIVARLGNINVVADFFVGTGILDSPGDAQINIINNSPLFLNVGNLTIPTGAGGQVTFNTFAMVSNSDLTTANRIPSYATPLTTAAAFSQFTTASSSPAPEITVHSTYNPAFDTVNTFPTGYTPTAPDIYVNGVLSNTSPNGSLTLTNDKGSIIVAPEQGSSGLSVGGALRAATINISAGRNFVLTTAGFQSTGGDPADQWLAVVQANESPGGQPLLNAGTAANPITSQQLGLLPSPNPPAVGSIIAQNDVLISAQYLNINGLVQSGVDTHTLILGANLDSIIQADQTDYNNKIAQGAGASANPLYLLTTSSTDNISAYYDAKNQQILVDSTQVQGGYMQLTGHILSTGNGQIKVIDGYGNINITNNTATDIVLNALDTGGAGIAGKLVLVDTARHPTNNGVPDNNTPLTTTYILLGDTVTATSNSTGAGGNPISTSTVGRSSASYSPLAGQVYNWEDGNAATHTTTYHHSYDEFWSIPVIGTDSYNTTGWDTSNEIDSSPHPIPGGPWISSAASPYAGYTFNAWNVVNSTDVVIDAHQDQHSHGCPPVFGYYSYDAYVTKQHGETEYYLNTVKADYTIPIQFTGGDTGTITVTSQTGDILLKGNINNTGGNVSLTASNGAINTIADVTIKANGINLSAKTGIGNTGLIKTNLLPGSSLSAITTTGDVNVSQVIGVLTYTAIQSTGSDANLTGQGNVTVTSVGDIVPASSNALIQGNLITLNSSTGNIGVAGQPIVILAANTQSGGLAANAKLDIYVKEQTGNLNLFTVTSFNGNIWLSAPAGNIVDHNPVRPIDSATQSELDTLWASMNMLGANPNVATAGDDLTNAAGQIAAFLSGKTSDYQTYWRYRHLSRDPNTGALTADAYSAMPTFVLSDAEKAIYKSQLGWTDAQIDAYVSTETDHFRALQTELQGWVAQNSVDPTNFANYNAAFNYATFITPAELAAEKANVASGATWTLDQLRYPMDGGVLGMTSFAIILPQTPNVYANAGNVTLLASGGIGVTNGQTVVDLSSMSNWASLTTAQKAALALAEPSDVTNVGGVLTIDQRLAIDIEALQGHIDATAGDNIFIASQDHDMVIHQVTSGTNSSSPVAADIRIKSGNGLYQAPSSPAYNVGSTKDINLILEAVTTSIGTSAAPVLISATANSPVTAQAKQDVYIQQVNGNLLLQQVTAITGIARIIAKGSITADYSQGSHTVVFANSLDLEATGNVGTSTSRLLIQLGATGQLTGNVTGNTYIESANQLNVGTFTSTTGSVDLLIDSGDANLGHIVANAGTVKIFTQLGDILDANTDGTTDIVAKNISLSAVQGKIGTSTKKVTLDTSATTTGTVFAFAFSDVYLDDVNGDMRLDQITGEHGNVTLVADGSIVDGTNDARTKVSGVNINLTATNGSIGTSTHDLAIDSSNPTAGVFNATAHNNIYVTEVAGALNIGQVQATLGDVRLSVPELADLLEDMVLTAASIITAGANILLRVGTDFNMATGSLIQAGGGVEVQGDYKTGATFSPDPASTFNVFGQIKGSPIYIHGDAAGDTFNIAVIVAGNPMKVEALGANATFNVSSDAPTNQGNLAGINAKLTIQADAGTSNRLIVSDFAGTTSKTVTVTNSTITGIATGQITYATQNGAAFTHGATNDGILLQGSGSAATTFNIQSTLSGSTTLMKGGAANDTFNIGSAANSLAGILGVLTVDGVANVATPTTTLTCGADSATLPTGDSVSFNDQGDTTTGLTYDLFATTFQSSMLTNAITFLNTESVTLNTAIPGTTTNLHTTGAITNTFINGNVNSDVVNVLDTGANANVSVNAGNGNNSIYVQKTGASSFTQLAGGAGNDLYDIGSNAAVSVAPGSGSLDNIHGVLCIDAGSGTGNRLVLDNSSGSVNSNVVFTNDKITSLAVNATIDYSAAGGFNDLAAPTTYDGILALGSNAGADTFNIQSTLAGSTSKIVGGQYNDVFNLGNANSLGTLVGNLTVDGGANLSTPTNSVSVQNAGNTISASRSLAVGDTVNFNDQADNAAGGFTYALTKNSLDRSGLPQTQPAITYAALETINLNTALNASIVNVASTADNADTTINGSINATPTSDTITVASAGAGSIVNVNGGTGDSTFNLQTTGVNSFTRITGFAGNDRVNVSSMAGSANAGSTDGINGVLAIDAGAGSANRLFFDDSTGVATPNIVLDSDTIVGLTPATVFYKASAGSFTDPTATFGDGILLRGSDNGGNTFNIRSTLLGSTTEIDGGGDNDTFNVSSDAPANHGNLANILGALTLLGGTGAANRLTVSDYGNSIVAKTNVIQTTATVDGAAFQQIQNFAGSVINYNAPGSFNDVVSQVDLADGIHLIGSHTLGTTFTFRTTLALSTITAEGGLAADNFNVGSSLAANDGNLDLIQGLLTVIGNGGADALEANDHGATGAFNYIVTPTQILNDPSSQPTVPHATVPPAHTFAGILYDNTGVAGSDTVTTMRLDGTDQPNIFNVSPSKLTTYTINGNLPAAGVPTVGGGDYLQLNTSQLAGGTGGRVLHITSVGNGYWSFTDGSKLVNFLSIERFNHVATTTTVQRIGTVSIITVRDAETGAIKYQIRENVAGKFTVAQADVNFDGLPDTIIAPGAGQVSTIQIFSGAPSASGAYTGALLGSIPVYNAAFKGGVNIATGDVNGDGAIDLIVAPASGMLNPQIQVFDGLKLLTTHALLGPTVLAFEAGYFGGVTLAAGDFTLDGYADIVAGRSTGLPTINVFDGKTRGLVKSFSAFLTTFKGGESVAAGDYNGDGVPDIIVGAGPGNYLPIINVYDGATLFTQTTPKLFTTLLVGAATYQGGLTVQVAPVNGGNPGFIERDYIVGVLNSGAYYYFTLLPNDAAWWQPALTSNFPGVISQTTFDARGNAYLLQDNGTLLVWRNGSALAIVSRNVQSFKVGVDGSVYLLNSTGYLYRYLNNVYTLMATNVVSYSVDASNRAYFQRVNGDLFLWVPSKLTSIATSVTSFDVTSAGVVYFLQSTGLAYTPATNGNLKRWVAGVTTSIAGSVTSFQLGKDGVVRYLQTTGDLGQWNGAPSTLTSNVASFAVASDGTAYLLTTGGALSSYRNGVATPILTAVTSLTLTPNGTLYVLRGGNVMRLMNGSWSTLLTGAKSFGVVGDGAAVYALLFSGKVVQWRDNNVTTVSTNVTSMSVAANGGVYALTATGVLQHWQLKTLTTMLSGVKTFTIAGDGIIYALLTNGSLSQWQGTAWSLLTSAVTAFLVAPDSTLYVLKTNSLYKYQATTATLLWSQVSSIAFAHQGSVLNATLTNSTVVPFNT